MYQKKKNMSRDYHASFTSLVGTSTMRLVYFTLMNIWTTSTRSLYRAYDSKITILLSLVQAGKKEKFTRNCVSRNQQEKWNMETRKQI